ncbi:hypothetical protein V8G54_002070 [Vigna mungo]|uniref:Uncharacterized protein n=1 Tax=Vigna mungo TaxID=3915 RepID=A0AAQ3P9G6_VIGMU
MGTKVRAELLKQKEATSLSLCQKKKKINRKTTRYTDSDVTVELPINNIIEVLHNLLLSGLRILLLRIVTSLFQPPLTCRLQISTPNHRKSYRKPTEQKTQTLRLRLRQRERRHQQRVRWLPWQSPWQI